MIIQRKNRSWCHVTLAFSCLLAGILDVSAQKTAEIFGRLAPMRNSCDVNCQADAGSVDMAVLSVAPWDSYRQTLQPVFKLSAEDALALAIPNTTAYDEKILDVLALSLKAALPGASFDDNKAIQSASELSASKLPALSTNGLGTDALTRYLVATALYQEVQLLNSYVKDAAIPEGWTPYLVRLQVSLMPRQRGLPLDAYSTISFFPELSGALTNNITDALTNNNTNVLKARQQGIKVIPLLVTDNLEALLESRSSDRIRQLTLALAAAIKGVGIKTSLETLNEQIQSILGRDLNSTFTVARLCDNTIRCRFGASLRPQKQPTYTMVPQTHNVSLLLLMPKDLADDTNALNRTVRLCATTQMINVHSGDKLRLRTYKELLKEYKELCKGYRVNPRHTNYHNADETMWTLIDIASTNDFPTFDKAVRGLQPTEKQSKTNDVHRSQFWFVHPFWTDFISIRGGSQYAGATFIVPQKQYPRFDFTLASEEEKYLLLLDDTKTAATITLTGRDLNASEFAAWLSLDPKFCGPQIQLAAVSTKISDSGKQIVFTFPSLAAYNLFITSPSPRENVGRLTIRVLDRYAEVFRHKPP